MIINIITVILLIFSCIAMFIFFKSIKDLKKDMVALRKLENEQDGTQQTIPVVTVKPKE